MSSPTRDQQPLSGDPVARVLVAGASGFAGALAAQIVWNHPRLELARLTARSDVGTPLEDLYPRYRVPMTLTEIDPTKLEDIDAALVAYPHGASAPLVAELRGLDVTVVDLSADFRFLNLPTYERWYGTHGAPELLNGAVYGLPELHRKDIARAQLIGSPGCYPTAALLALAPLAEEGLIEDVVIDAKSGVSGAGRDGAGTHFVTVGENVTPYGAAGHRHRPEIVQELERMGAKSSLSFIPHLLPLDQGELVSCYVRATGDVTPSDLEELYAKRYEAEPFIEIVADPPGVRDVRDTNLCRIHAMVEPDGGRIIVFAAIDNLWKGASGQAVQNLNIALGIDETEGLT